jgi:hypothetical protein
LSEIIYIFSLSLAVATAPLYFLQFTFICMKYIIVFILFFTAQATAQTAGLYNQISNDVHVIHSGILNQDRQLYIHVPKLDSGDKNKPLPVLYLLDGENHFHIISAYIEYLRHWKVIPQQ